MSRFSKKATLRKIARESKNALAAVDAIKELTRIEASDTDLANAKAKIADLQKQVESKTSESLQRFAELCALRSKVKDVEDSASTIAGLKRQIGDLEKQLQDALAPRPDSALMNTERDKLRRVLNEKGQFYFKTPRGYIFNCEGMAGNLHHMVGVAINVTNPPTAKHALKIENQDVYWVEKSEKVLFNDMLLYPGTLR